MNNYTCINVYQSDANKLRGLKAVGAISSMSEFIHLLVLKELQNMRIKGIVKNFGEN